MYTNRILSKWWYIHITEYSATIKNEKVNLYVQWRGSFQDN